MILGANLCNYRDNLFRYLLLQFLDLAIPLLNFRSQTGNLLVESDHLLGLQNHIEMVLRVHLETSHYMSVRELMTAVTDQSHII